APGLGQVVGQGHGEAPGVGRGDQLLRVRPGPRLEPRLERVVPLVRPAPQLHGPLAGLQGVVDPPPREVLDLRGDLVPGGEAEQGGEVHRRAGREPVTYRWPRILSLRPTHGLVVAAVNPDVQSAASGVTGVARSLGSAVSPMLATALKG